MTVLLLFVLGLAALVAGSELLVRGASKLAISWGISPLVVGLTVVAGGRFEYLDGNDLAIGNVVGSNLFNVLFILGLCAAIVPLAVASQIVRQEVPIMIAASLLLVAMTLDGRISRVEAGVLFGLLVAYTAFLVVQSRRAAGQRSARRLSRGSPRALAPAGAAAPPRHGRRTDARPATLCGALCRKLQSRPSNGRHPARPRTPTHLAAAGKPASGLVD